MDPKRPRAEVIPQEKATSSRGIHEEEGNTTPLCGGRRRGAAKLPGTWSPTGFGKKGKATVRSKLKGGKENFSKGM